MDSSNPVIQSVLAKGVATFSFLSAAAMLGFSRQAAYSCRSRGDFPVRTRQIGKRLVIFASDLIIYLESGESQASQSVSQIPRTFRVRTGRPTKRESLTATKLGVSVRELRAMAQNGVAGGADHA